VARKTSRHRRGGRRVAKGGGFGDLTRGAALAGPRPKVNSTTTRWPRPSTASTRPSSSIATRPWHSAAAVQRATADWVAWWNERRLHSACGDLPPAEFEATYLAPESGGHYGRLMHKPESSRRPGRFTGHVTPEFAESSMNVFGGLKAWRTDQVRSTSKCASPTARELVDRVCFRSPMSTTRSPSPKAVSQSPSVSARSKLDVWRNRSYEAVHAEPIPLLR
jgi:hypothetical protein